MVRVSNLVVGIVNAVSMAIGVVAMVFALYFHIRGSTQCQSALQNPLLISGAIVFAVSLLGFVGSCFRTNVFMYIYLFCTFLFIFCLIGYTAFAYVITNETAGKVVSDKGFNQYKTPDFSNWLNQHFVKNKTWESVKSCMVEARVCNQNAQSLSAVQSGCCKQPAECRVNNKNATASAGDCNAWNNVERELCFNCKTCKAGVVASIRHEWKNLAICNVAVLIFTMLVYTIGCCAKANNRRERKMRRYY